MIIHIQICKGCKKSFVDEEELIKCPICGDKRIEIVERNKVGKEGKRR